MTTRSSWCSAAWRCRGGRGTIVGALAGAALLVIITNAVLLFGLPFQFQLIIKGIVIVIAAALNARITAGARST
jgi:ribose/xylose/arabinose/galactoside ABC-type transport system permease subunit